MTYAFGRKIKRKEVETKDELIPLILERAEESSPRGIATGTAIKRYCHYINNTDNPKWIDLFDESDKEFFKEIPQEFKPKTKKAIKPNMADIENVEVNVETVKMKDQNFNPELFVPIKSNTPLDKLISNKEGIMPATNTIVLGDPGIGKTTVMLDLLSNINKSNEGKRVLFISGEMNRIDLAEYMERLPGADELDIFFTMDYDENCSAALQKVLNQGWDVVLMDSFDEVKESLNEDLGLSGTKAEKWLIDLMVNHNLGRNETEKHTAFLAIQQVTKGGKFVGSNKLKHNTTAMLEMRYDKSSKKPKLYYTKNRRGNTELDMFFEITSNGIQYDIIRFKREQEFRTQIEFDQDDEKESSKKIADIFNLDTDENGNFIDKEEEEKDEEFETENS